MMSCLTLFIIGVIVVVALSVLGSRQRERELEKMFGGRESLTEEQFYEQYFAAEGVPKDVVLGVKHIFERELDVDFSRLRPEDDFGSNLNYFWQEDDLADVDVLKSFEKEFGIELVQADASRMGTFRSFVQVVWEKVQKKNV